MLAKIAEEGKDKPETKPHENIIIPPPPPIILQATELVRMPYMFHKILGY
jgi:hypothetical protein